MAASFQFMEVSRLLTSYSNGSAFIQKPSFFSSVSSSSSSSIFARKLRKQNRSAMSFFHPKNSTRKSFTCQNSESETEEPTDAEREGWEKRKSESSDEEQHIGGWQWSLNWDAVTPQLIIGSCPRSANDVDRLVNEAGIDAIVNLQSDICFEALKIPADSIRERAIELGVFWERVPIRDFDHGDQALMLPEAVRMLNLLQHRGLRVYCHCTAGINRASLSVLGYLTFTQGMSLEEGLLMVKSARKVAHPYLDCWHEVHRRLLDGRQEELTALAKEIYANRCAGGIHGNAATDWSGAQGRAISRSFSRWLEVDMLASNMEKEILERKSSSNEAALLVKIAALEAEMKASQTVLQVSDSDLRVSDDLIMVEVKEEEDLECDVVTRTCASSKDEEEVKEVVSLNGSGNSTAHSNGASVSDSLVAP